MRSRPLLAVVAGFITIAGPLSSPQRATETAHLTITWVAGAATAEEVAAAEELGERTYETLRDWLGPQRLPERKATVVLAGEGLVDGRSKTPHVDADGRIVLYRYDETGYFGKLAHEMVHALRFRTEWWKDGFLEEGFADLVAYEAGLADATFPWFGFAPEVAAGQWVLHGEDIPLPTLLRSHRDLNTRCQWQAYPLRGSFFVYLLRRFGRDPMFRLAYGDPAATPERYAVVFERGFEDLVEDWRDDLSERLAASAALRARSIAYRSDSPVRFTLGSDKICRPGRDF